MQRPVIAKIILILFVAAVSVFSLLPGTYTPVFVVNHDKAAHMVAFFLLSFLVCRAFKCGKSAGMLLFTGLFALFIETAQLLFTERGFSSEDILFDVFGVLIFLGFRYLAVSLKNRTAG